MQLSQLLFLVALLSLPIALWGTIWLYLYPFFEGCGFPTPPATLAQSRAPFRLFTLGDPQLEGDSSLPDPNASVYPSVESLLPDLRNATTTLERRDIALKAVRGIIKDSGKWLKGKRKAIDLWGNDWYLAHIVRSNVWWTEPTHISVLGDLLGSQWITDGEFERRAGRYWNIVMNGLEKVPDRVFGVEEASTVASPVEDEPAEPISHLQSYFGDSDTPESAAPEVAEEQLGIAEPVLKFRLERMTTEDSLADVPAMEEAEDPVMEPTEESTTEESNKPKIEAVVGLLVTEEEAKHDAKTARHYLQETETFVPNLENGGKEEDHSTEDSVGETEKTHNDGLHDQLLEAMKDKLANDNKETGSETNVEETNDKPEIVTEERPLPIRRRLWGGTTEVLGEDSRWRKRVINIAGNHDVGYAGDLDEFRVDRFEKAFGSTNWDIWFTLPGEFRNKTEHKLSDAVLDSSIDDSSKPALRLVILNTMNFDTPAWSDALQMETYSFMNHIITSARPVEDKTHATILLTHIPLEKEKGVCVDAPYFAFFEDGQGVREQNMLSDHATKIVLEGIYGLNSNKNSPGNGLGRNGIVVNGHDHEGCDVMHWIRQDALEDQCSVDQVQVNDAYWAKSKSIENAEATLTSDDLASDVISTPTNINVFAEATSSAKRGYQHIIEVPKLDLPPKWRARRFPPLLYDIDENDRCTTISKSPRIREITLRSIMGEFAGYAGFLSAWFDTSLGERGEWVFEFNTCSVGIQHWWWGVHIIDFTLIVLFITAGMICVLEKRGLVGDMSASKQSETKVQKLSIPDQQVFSRASKSTNGINGTSTYTKPLHRLADEKYR